MKSDEATARRRVLHSLAAGLAGFFAYGVATRTEARVFATLALQDSNPVKVPAGYYDCKTQLYMDARTGKPMFARSAGGETRVLSARELDELGASLDVHEASRKIQVAQTCTVSRQTSYSTTRCCPIVTDSQRDQDCDDTPEPDKDWK